MRRVAAAIAGVVAVLALCAPASASDKSVTIVGVNQGYSPNSVTVDPGDTVTWTNRDPTPAPHNALCDEGCPEPFSSGDPGATGTTGHYRFRYSGTYNYKCAVHPNMKGTVVVTGSVHPPATASASSPSSPAASTASGQSASASATANSGASASASASSPSTPSAAVAEGGAVGAGPGRTPLPPVAQLPLPQPQVRVRQARSEGTPWWVLVPSALVLLVASAACAVAWLAPRPLRLRRRLEAPS